MKILRRLFKNKGHAPEPIKKPLIEVVPPMGSLKGGTWSEEIAIFEPSMGFFNARAIQIKSK